MENVRITSSAGGTIAATVHRPSIATEKLAILCPGYLDTRDYAHLVDLAERLTQLGYTAVRFDPTGTWGSEGDISQYLMSQYLKDIESVLEYMLTEYAYSQVLLGGHSRGGQMAVLYAARDPRISEVIAIMPSHGPIEGVRRSEWEAAGTKASDRDIPGSDERKHFIVPFAHVLDRDQFDALTDVEKVRVPIYFFAGELDDLVPPEEVQELFEVANEPKRYTLLKGIGHDYRLDPAEVQSVNNEIIKALQARG